MPCREGEGEGRVCNRHRTVSILLRPHPDPEFLLPPSMIHLADSALELSNGIPFNPFNPFNPVAQLQYQVSVCVRTAYSSSVVSSWPSLTVSLRWQTGRQAPNPIPSHPIPSLNKYVHVKQKVDQLTCCLIPR
jgi:hypothetical protein